MLPRSILRSFRVFMLFPTARTRAERRLIRRWLAIERIGVILGLIASCTAVFGIISWYLESDARQIERANKTFEAVSGALSTIAESRGKETEIGQSQSVALLSNLKRDLATIDLNDLTLQGISISSPIVQETGSSMVLKSIYIDGKSPNSPQNSQAMDLGVNQPECKVAFVALVDYLVLIDPKLKPKGICSYGSLMITGLSLQSSNLIQFPPSVKYSELRSGGLRKAFQVRPFEIEENESEKATESPSDDSSLPTALILDDSTTFGSKIQSTAGFVKVTRSDLRRTTAELYARRVRVYSSALNSSIIKVPAISDYYAEKKEEARQLAALRAIKDEIRKLKKVKRDTAAAQRAKQLEESMFEALAVRWRFPVHMGSDVQSEPPKLEISDSDIRGMDLSGIEPEAITLYRVCADSTTKLPKGISAKQCSGSGLVYWNGVRDCLAAAKKSMAECEDFASSKVARPQSGGSEKDGFFRGPIVLNFRVDLVGPLGGELLDNWFKTVRGGQTSLNNRLRIGSPPHRPFDYTEEAAPRKTPSPFFVLDSLEGTMTYPANAITTF